MAKPSLLLSAAIVGGLMVGSSAQAAESGVKVGVLICKVEPG